MRSAVECTLQQPRSSGPKAEPTRGALRWALFFCLPYLLFGLVWVFTNPPGAAPDEPDHLAKALAAARFDVGVPFEGSLGDSPGAIRNASIARTVMIPARLAPEGLTCPAFQPDTTAACQPDSAPGGEGLVAYTTPVGSYPVFAYVPLGIVANLAATPEEAFWLARLSSLMLSVAMLSLGVWHLMRWLGRGAAAGIALTMTPVAVFAAASVSTSGLEITSAVTVAAITIVATRHPESLSVASTAALLAVGGAALILSRQGGVITFGLLACIALSRGGLSVIVRELRRGSAAMVGVVAVIALSTIALLAWERTFNKSPALTGSPLTLEALPSWTSQTLGHVVTGVGLFGWLDTPLPGPSVALWVTALLFVIGTAALTGRRADVATIALAASALLAISYMAYASVFFPIGAGLQGRHLIPTFAVIPILAGVVVHELAGLSGLPRVRVRQALILGIVVPLVQFIAIVANGHRYAVGVSGPWWFLPDAEWSPIGGWWVWLVVAFSAAAIMAISLIRSGTSESVPAK